jgi:hypothetical protein
VSAVYGTAVAKNSPKVGDLHGLVLFDIPVGGIDWRGHESGRHWPRRS